VKTGHEVVGQMASIPVELKAGEAVMRALWIIDFVILSDYRGRQLGQQLMQAALDAGHRTMLALGYNENSWSVLRRHNWMPLGHINRYHTLLFPGDAARELSRFRLARAAANLCYTPFRPRLKRLRPDAGGEVREVQEFDSSFDELWRRAARQWPCAIVRDSRYLDWQYRKQPGKRFDVLGYYRNERLLGYLVLFFRKAEGGGSSPKVSLTELCYNADEATPVIDELLKAALRLALERRAGALVTDVRDPRLEERLRHFGFRAVKNGPPFSALTAAQPDFIYQADDWYLTRGDCDVSIFEDPNI
jgi:hypothetical protein